MQNIHASLQSKVHGSKACDLDLCYAMCRWRFAPRCSIQTLTAMEASALTSSRTSGAPRSLYPRLVTLVCRSSDQSISLHGLSFLQTPCWVPGVAVHLLPADGSKPRRPSCPRDRAHVQDGPAQVREHREDLDPEVRHVEDWVTRAGAAPLVLRRTVAGPGRVSFAFDRVLYCCMMNQIGFAVHCVVPNVVLCHSEAVILNVQKLVCGTVLRWVMLPIAMRRVHVFGFFPSPFVGGEGDTGVPYFYCVADNIEYVKYHGKNEATFFP